MSAPDWKHWLAKREVKWWQGAALSLGLDPYSLHEHPEYWESMQGKPMMSNRAFKTPQDRLAFDKRYDLVATCINDTLGQPQLGRAILLCIVDITVLAAWLQAREFLLPPELSGMGLIALSPNAATQNPSFTKVDAVLPSGQYPKEIWAPEARRVADALHNKDTPHGWYSKLSSIADAVAKDLLKRNVLGVRGPVSGSTILREALQGKKWKRPIPPK